MNLISLITEHSKKNLFLLFSLIFLIALGISNFKLDASSDTLLLENDPDLKLYRENTEKYGSNDFLIVTFSPYQELLSKPSIILIKDIVKKISSLDRVENVLSLLDVPLLENNPNVSLSDVADSVETLNSESINIDLAKRVFSSNSVYQNLLISEDLNTTAFQVTLKRNLNYENLINERYALYDSLDSNKEEKLKSINELIEIEKNNATAEDEILVSDMRDLISDYNEVGELFLGGGAMITVDTIKFISQDLTIFGLTVLLIFIVVLSLIFKNFIWVSIPLITASLTSLLCMGAVGWFNWKVTVVSANFVSILMIISISLMVHLIVRYQELGIFNKEINQKDLVNKTLRQMFLPCLYTALTTIAAFASLIVSDIKPIIDFGLIMVIGISITFIFAFIFFGSSLSIIKKGYLDLGSDKSKNITLYMHSFVENYPIPILISSFIIFAFSVLGISQLTVENKFIDYFKPSTEIYKGLSLIDQKLGGTATLDVIIDAPESEDEDIDITFDDEFDDFGEILEDEIDQQGYWFNSDNLFYLETIHDYLENRPEIGKVLSVSSGIKLAEIANSGERLTDLELALLRKLLPEDIESQLLSAYITNDDNQVRLSARVIESYEGLNRKELISSVKYDLENKFNISEDKYKLTGISVIYNNLLQSLFGSLIGSIGIVFLSIFVMFLFLFKSIKLASIGMIPNFLAAGAVIGTIGLTGIPLDVMTVTVAAVSIGMGVDNTIHYIFRFKKEFLESNDYLKSTKNTHATIGRALFYTSTTIVLGFLVLATSNFSPTVFFGIFTSLSMIMAIIGSLFLLPVLLTKLKAMN
ncbi:MAG: RND family transporter [Gammaproteobacteria bacterium]